MAETILVEDTRRPAPIVHFGGATRTAAPPEKRRVGAKGFHLMQMSAMGLPVPPGFIIETSVCRRYLEAGRIPGELRVALVGAMATLEASTGRSFSGKGRPLLVSVRSGSVSSMPGMLETILDIGLTDRSVEELAADSGNPRFAWDSYRRLISSYGSTVGRIPRARFEEVFQEEKARSGAVLDLEADAEVHRRAAERSLAIYQAALGEPFPQDPHRQLGEAVEAVFRSWTGPRAVEYRAHHRISDDDGTAVTVQAMVFGNYGYGSGTGVAFTRNPSTGEASMYIDYLLNAQGEDIVGGGGDPEGGEELKRSLPRAHAGLVEVGRALEARFADVQDLEFTVERGELWLLQTRTAKRTPLAAVRIAVALAEEGVIDRRTALDRLQEVDLSHVREPRLELPEGLLPAARGEVASLGSLFGRIALSSERARRLKREGDPVILVRPETRTDDLPGIIAADGIITARGGRTSHAAVVARHLGKACLVGCSPMEIDEAGETVRIGELKFGEGDWISIDHRTGGIYPGRFESSLEEEDGALRKARQWVRELGPADHPLHSAAR